MLYIGTFLVDLLLRYLYNIVTANEQCRQTLEVEDEKFSGLFFLYIYDSYCYIVIPDAVRKCVRLLIKARPYKLLPTI